MNVVYNSFGGRFSDSPRAIHAALRARGLGTSHVWLADPAHRDGFPADVETVDVGAPEAVEALEAADLVVANTHTELAWRKRADAVYLQTWHGTPLKRIHWDVLWAPAGRLERLSRDVALWDYLVSPNPASTPRLRGAFRFEGEVLETGYPRNDVLSAPARDRIRARVRRTLGIGDETTAVLYAPTWRDDVVFADGQDVMRADGDPIALDLDVDRFVAALGASHALLLRLHYTLTGRLAAVAHASVADVSRHSDIGELYLAADVLVTDYSSAMFDFAVTGKPIVFLAADLDRYRDSLRGFYFDLFADAPAPVTVTTDELIRALGDLEAGAAAHAERYARFRETFCPFDDGGATERLVDRLFEGGELRRPSEARAAD